MAEIKEDFGTGGAGLVPNGSRQPSLATALRDVADDLADLNDGLGGTGTTITPTVSAGALAAFTDPPSAAEMANLRTLVNELRATVLALVTAVEAGSGGGGGVDLRTVKG